MTRPRFHLAFPVHNLEAARAFYGGLLGCPEGRSAADWVDFDFFGHQIVAHLPAADRAGAQTSSVDGEDVPVRHFGVILEPEAWRALADKLRSAGVGFLIEPQTRFAGSAGEQPRCSSSIRAAMRSNSRRSPTTRWCSIATHSRRTAVGPPASMRAIRLTASASGSIATAM